MKAHQDIEAHRMETVVERYTRLQRVYKYELAVHYALFFILGFVVGALISELHH